MKITRCDCGRFIPHNQVDCEKCFNERNIKIIKKYILKHNDIPTRNK